MRDNSYGQLRTGLRRMTAHIKAELPEVGRGVLLRLFLPYSLGPSV